jgi:hypothetical protein
MTRSELVHVLPVELVGWLLRHLDLDVEVPWVLLATADAGVKLAAAMLCRLPTNVNVVAGLTHLSESPETMAALDVMAAEAVVPMAKTMDVLVPIVWVRPDARPTQGWWGLPAGG